MYVGACAIRSGWAVFFIESTLSCMCAEGLLFASIGVKNVLLS